MTKRISAILILVLAVIAAIVATGLIAGYPVWAFIIIYWLTLTLKNTIDFFQKGSGEKTCQKQ